MKSIKQKRSIKYPLVISAVLILLLSAGAGVALKLRSNSSVAKSTQTAKDTSTTQDSTTSPKANAAPSSDTKTTNDVPVSANMTAQFTQLSEDDKGTITVAGSVTNSSSNGTCVFTFTNPNDKPYIQQTSGVSKAETTVCGPLSISSLNFSYLGTWSVNFRFYNDSQQAVADGTIEIK